MTGSQERVPGYAIINEGLLQPLNTSTTTVFGTQVLNPQRLNLTVQMLSMMCVSVYVFNDLHTGYYFIVASSREREKHDSTIEAVYI